MKQSLSLFIAIVISLMLNACSASSDNATKAVVSSPAPSPTENIEQAIIAKNKAAWDAYKDKDVAGIKAYTAEDYESYTQEGPSNLQQDIANKDKLNIEAYKVVEPKVRMATKDVAILRYKWEPKATFEGRQIKPVFVTEVWVNRDGKWQVVSYQETLLKQ